MPGLSVAILGATGLVGRECVRQFSESPRFARVVRLTRRPLQPFARENVETQILDFDALEHSPDVFRVTHLLCALGTTIGTAGSREQFRRVDLEYPLAAARVALQQGTRHFLLVSALGADATSRIFYNRVKGELEDALRALTFRSLTIVRPSLLLGDREEFRLGEVVAKFFAPLAPRKYKPVEASSVARALVRAAEEDREGVRVIESSQIDA
jgi:uncharacterized protein YbjT (DUF2867 family)